MKVTATPLDPAFTPIKLEITLESRRELDALYQLGNHSDTVSNNILQFATHKKEIAAVLFAIWDELRKQG